MKIQRFYSLRKNDGAKVVFAALTAEVLIPFLSNICAYDGLIISFSFNVGGASCPALEQLNSRHLCTVILEKWYKNLFEKYIRRVRTAHQPLKAPEGRKVCRNTTTP